MNKDEVDRFTFGGHDLTDLLWVNPTRRLGLRMNNVTVKVPGSAGERHVRTELEPLTIPLHVRLRCSDGDHEAVARFRRTITTILVTDEPKPLVLPDEPTVYYMAMLSDPGELTTLWHTGAADIEFTAFDPIAYGQERDDDLKAGTTMVFAEGTWETWPTLVLVSEGGQVSVSDALGHKLTVEQAPGAGSAVVVDMHGRTTTVDGQAAPLVLGSKYFALQPGRNDLTVTGAHGTISWQERWQ